MLGMLQGRRRVTALLLQPSPGLETFNRGKMAGNQPLILKKNIGRCSRRMRSPCGHGTAEAAVSPGVAVRSESRSGACREPGGHGCQQLPPPQPGFFLCRKEK